MEKAIAEFINNFVVVSSLLALVIFTVIGIHDLRKYLKEYHRGGKTKPH